LSHTGGGGEGGDAGGGAIARPVTLAAFFVSGALGLVHEVTWARMFYPVFGMNLYALTVVLATFMGGLGLGSAVLGKWADRFRRPLRLFALVEMGIGGCALCVPPLTHLFPAVIAAATPLGTPGLLVHLLRLAGVASLILLPCFLMGGTFPAFSKGYVREEGRVGRDLAVLYAINTLGGAAGCLLAGTLLLPAHGITQIAYAAGAGNLVVGAVVWLFAPRMAPAGPGPEVQSPVVARAFGREPAGRPVLGILFLTGFLCLSCEILWTRALTQVLGGTYSSFPLILAALLIGITVGSAVFRGAIAGGDLPRALRLLSALLFVAVAGSFLVVFRLAGLTAFLEGLMAGGDGGGARLAAQFTLCLIAFLPSAILFGMLFPLCLRLYSHLTGRFAEEVGRAYAVNTVGAVVGVLLTGLLMIDRLGSGGTLVVLLVLNLAIVVLAVQVADTATDRPWRGRAPALLGAVGAALVVAFLFPRDLFFANQFAVLSLRIPGHKTILLQGEDGTSIATVVEEEERPFRYVKDGRVVPAKHRETYHSNWRGVGGTRIYLWNITSAYLATLLPSDPESILVIGYGSGRQSATLTSLPYPKRIEVVEINKLNFAASDFFFLDSAAVLRDPRVQVVVDDGRNYLLRSPRKYDVIIVDVGGLDADGSEFFYTQDFLRLCREHLRDGGYLFTWLDIGHLLGELGWMYQNTFRSVFPESSVWLGTKEPSSYGWLWVVGVNGTLQIDYQRLVERWGELTTHQLAELRLAGIHSVDDLLTLQACRLDRVPTRIAEARILTDGHPYYAKAWQRRGDVRDLLEGDFFRDLSYYSASFEHLYFGESVGGLQNIPDDQKETMARRRSDFYAMLRKATVGLVKAWLVDNLEAGTVLRADLERYVGLVGEHTAMSDRETDENIVAEAARAFVSGP